MYNWFRNYMNSSTIDNTLAFAEFDIRDYPAAFAAIHRRDSAEEKYEQIEQVRESKLNMELYEYETLRAQEMQKVIDKRRDDQNTLLVVIVLLLIVFAIFITSRYRFTRKQSQLISTQRQQLQAASTRC